ncbi:unnamed protein product [Microthlaspi erraticum]|uniref:Prolamin-like domain-containing protein n=1 Tax=Microthlaspi erraticum TaxID=1685480 RepID=A0A6D2KUE5_9BRAS|nr:unnamed protein product [Microthlaspi erraticum]
MKSVIFLLVATCITTSVNAQLPPGVPEMPDIYRCLSTLINIPGCIAEISESIVTGKFGDIGPACCKAFLEAESKCATTLFPPMLRQQCSRIAGPPTTL